MLDVLGLKECDMGEEKELVCTISAYERKGAAKMIWLVRDFAGTNTTDC
jgi:hypothetical protein